MHSSTAPVQGNPADETRLSKMLAFYRTFDDIFALTLSGGALQAREQRCPGVALALTGIGIGDLLRACR